jgi:hypothetical protein
MGKSGGGSDLKEVWKSQFEELWFETVFSNRKTLAIRVESSGMVRVLAPYGINHSRINEAIKSRIEWIRKKQKELSNSCVHEVLEDGSKLPILGERFTLRLMKAGISNQQKSKLANDELLITTSDLMKDSILKSVTDFYRDKTRDVVVERVKHFSGIVGVEPGKIAVRDQKTRWASCSSKKSLSFNLRCSMLPPELLDYVVIHELCHLLQMDHSKKFWNEVEKIIPEYAKQRTRLKNEGLKYFYLLRRD